MRLAWLLGAVIAAACTGSGDGDPTDNIEGRTTELCENITGMEALAWDYYNGVIVVDSILPPPFPVGNTFSHVDFPLLGFSYPAGWTPNELRGSGSVGVDLIRDDQRAIWRYASISAQGTVDVAAVVDAEMMAARSFFGRNGQGTVVCANRGSVERSPGTGIVSTFDNIVVRIEDQTVLLIASVTTVPGTGLSSVAIRLLSSPTNEFSERLYDTFIAIDWQLLVGDSGESGDRDNDGWLDSFDQFPDDPSRH